MSQDDRWPVFVDVHEPSLILTTLQKSFNAVKMPNEPRGFADYWWNNGKIQMWERKQSRELLGAIGKKLDTQLLKYKTKHPDAGIGIIQEGLITPAENGYCQLWRKTKSRGKNPRFIYVKGPEVPVEYVSYRAYLYRREMEGFPVIITEDEWDTAITLTAMVYNSVKKEHMGLNRYVVAKVDIRDPYTSLLMAHRGVGKKTAEKLVETFKTPWRLYTASFDAVRKASSKRVASFIYKDLGKNEDDSTTDNK